MELSESDQEFDRDVASEYFVVIQTRLLVDLESLGHVTLKSLKKTLSFSNIAVLVKYEPLLMS